MKRPKGDSRFPMMTPGARTSMFRKRFKRSLEDCKWLLIGGIWLVALALGYVGFRDYFFALGENRSPWDILYVSLQLFTLESGSVSGPVSWELQLARLLAPAATAYTAILALSIIFREQLRLLRVPFLKKHVVVCGLGRKGLLLTKRFRERGDKVVIIEKDQDNSLREQARECGATMLFGSATDVEMLRKARVKKAKYLISVCGDDGANAEAAIHTRKLVWNRKDKALVCLIHIVNPQLCNLLREREIEMGRLDAFRLELFNVFESGAKLLLEEHPPFRKIQGDQSATPHIIVVGLGRLGESLVINAARDWLYRNDKPSLRPRFTIIDRDAERKKASLCIRYPKLEKIFSLQPLQMGIEDPDFQRAEFMSGRNGCCDVTLIYVCLADEALALTAGLTLHKRIWAEKIPIVLRMTYSAGLATLLRGETNRQKSFADLNPFGLLDRTCTPDLVFGGTYETLAREIHEEYVHQQEQKGKTTTSNAAMVPWDQLPEQIKESNRNQAEHIRAKLDAIGCDIVLTTDWNIKSFEFTEEEVERMAEMEHERYVKERQHEGWRHGRVRDPVKKINPTLISWRELSKEARDKDRNTVKNLPNFLAKVGFHIYRTKANRS